MGQAGHSSTTHWFILHSKLNTTAHLLRIGWNRLQSTFLLFGTITFSGYLGCSIEWRLFQSSAVEKVMKFCRVLEQRCSLGTRISRTAWKLSCGLLLVLCPVQQWPLGHCYFLFGFCVYFLIIYKILAWLSAIHAVCCRHGVCSIFLWSKYLQCDTSTRKEVFMPEFFYFYSYVQKKTYIIMEMLLPDASKLKKRSQKLSYL